MELTRRDALAVLAGAGILGGGSAAAMSRDASKADDSSADSGGREAERVLAALVATAAVVYPSAVDNSEAFVETYGATKMDERPAYRDGAANTLAELDGEAKVFFDDAFASLDDTDRELLLERIGAKAAEPDPTGTTAERIRYYFVNEVLYALYTSPTGGELVGIENPQGYPGGTTSYRRGHRNE